MELGLAGCAALVTGAAGGIGRAVASALTAEGVAVGLLDRDLEAVAALAQTLRGAVACPADVTDEDAVQGAVRRAALTLGRLDLLVVCAGVSGPVGTALADTALRDWQRVFDVNVTGAFLALKHARPFLARSDRAAAVLVASDSALVATPGMVAYCASKGAVLQLARAAAVELAVDDIRVTAVCPSIVDTPMSRGDLGLDDGFAGQAYPVLSPDEVADQIVVLCSPRFGAVTGTALVADFGYSARSGFPA